MAWLVVTFPPQGRAWDRSTRRPGRDLDHCRADTSAQLTAEFKIVTPSVLEPNAANMTIRTDRRFAVLDGVPGLQNA